MHQVHLVMIYKVFKPQFALARSQSGLFISPFTVVVLLPHVCRTLANTRTRISMVREHEYLKHDRYSVRLVKMREIMVTTLEDPNLVSYNC